MYVTCKMNEAIVEEKTCILNSILTFYMYPSFSMPTAEPISKMTISNACGFGGASFVYLDLFVA